MNPKDDLTAAEKALHNFQDIRVKHFYDAQKNSGTLIAKDLPIKAKVAWDIYLFYPKGVTWGEKIPKPLIWMHQMSDTDAESKYHRTGDDLKNGLFEAMVSLN